MRSKNSELYNYLLSDYSTVAYKPANPFLKRTLLFLISLLLVVIIFAVTSYSTGSKFDLGSSEQAKQDSSNYRVLDLANGNQIVVDCSGLTDIECQEAMEEAVENSGGGSGSGSSGSEDNSPAGGSDSSLVQDLINNGVITQEQYNNYISALIIEEVIPEMNIESFLELLLEEGFIIDEITTTDELINGIKEKPGFNTINEFDLTNYGWLTAINDIGGQGTLFKAERLSIDDSEIREIQYTKFVINELENLFENDRNIFIDKLTEEELSSLLNLDKETTPDSVIDPIYAGTFGAKAFTYDDQFNQIFNAQGQAVREFFDHEHDHSDYFANMVKYNCRFYSSSCSEDLSDTVEELNQYPDSQKILRIGNFALFTYLGQLSSNSHGALTDLDPVRLTSNPEKVVLRPRLISVNLFPFDYQNLNHDDGELYSIDATLEELFIEEVKNSNTISFTLNVNDGTIQKNDGGVITSSNREDIEEYRILVTEMRLLTIKAGEALIDDMGWSRPRQFESGSIYNIVREEIKMHTIKDNSVSTGAYSASSTQQGIFSISELSTTYTHNTKDQTITKSTPNSQEAFSSNEGEWLEYRIRVLLASRIIQDAMDSILPNAEEFSDLSQEDKRIYSILYGINLFIIDETYVYHYPSMNDWKMTIGNHMDNLSQELDEQINGPLHSIVVDYENTGIRLDLLMIQFRDFDVNRNQVYDGRILEQDYRYSEDQFFELIDLGPIMQHDEYGEYIEDHSLKYNQWAFEVRTQAFYDAVFSKLIEKFPDVRYSQWLTSTRSDMLPYRNDYGQFFRIHGLGMHSPNIVSNTGVYSSGIWPPHPLFPEIENSLPASVEDLGNGSGRYYPIFYGLSNVLQQLNSISTASKNKVAIWLTTKTRLTKGDAIVPEDINRYGPDAYWDEGCDCIEDGDNYGDAYAESYFRAAANSETIEGFYPQWNFLPQDKDFLHTVMNELNEVFGFENRQILYDAWVTINGERVSVGPQKLRNPNDNFNVWAAKGVGYESGKEGNVYRVIINLDSGTKRNEIILNDGTNGEPVKMQIGSDVLEISDAKIFIPQGIHREYEYFMTIIGGSPENSIIKVVDDTELTVTGAKILTASDPNNDGIYQNVEIEVNGVDTYEFDDLKITQGTVGNPSFETVKFHRIRDIEALSEEISINGNTASVNIKELSKHGFWVVQDPRALSITNT